MASEHPDFSGRIVGNWQLVRVLGRGAFGSVYECSHVTIGGRRAAAKILHPHMAFDPDIKSRFVTEASAASRAQHENIVQVFDAGVTPDGLCYVIMELLVGPSLRQVLRQGALSPARAAEICCQVASALSSAHAQGIVHRDLKPENILVLSRTGADFVKVVDFGIAKLRGGDNHTATGMWIGTPAYMSPEQWRTMPDIDGRSDVYSLGVILFQCVTGKLPFHSDTPYGWLAAHLSEEVPDPALLSPIPSELAKLIVRMLAKAREHRPQTMVEVVALLSPVHPKGANLSAMRPTVISMPMVPSTPAPVLNTPLPSASVPETSTIRGSTGEMALIVPRKRRVGLWAFGLLGLSGLLGLGGILGMLLVPGTKQPVVQSLPPKEPVVPVPLKEEVPKELAILGPGRLAIGWGTVRNKTDSPAHLVDVPRFALGKREVSMEEFREYAVAVKLPSPLPWDGIDEFAMVARLPVNQVTHAQAEAYCKWRYAAIGGRLPTEEEWEFAARQGQAERRFPWGNAVPTPQRANIGGARTLLPVDSLADGATPQGIMNLIGNVSEWTASPARPYPGSTATLQKGIIVRGGGALSLAKDISATSRVSVDPRHADAFVGFRCAAGLK